MPQTSHRHNVEHKGKGQIQRDIYIKYDYIYIEFKVRCETSREQFCLEERSDWEGVKKGLWGLELLFLELIT